MKFLSKTVDKYENQFSYTRLILIGLLILFRMEILFKRRSQMSCIGWVEIYFKIYMKRVLGVIINS